MKHAHTVYKIALGVLLLVACPLIHAQAPAAQSEARIAHLEAENAKLRQQVRQPAVSQAKEILTPEEKILNELFTEMFSTRTAGGDEVVNLLHKYGFVHKGPVPTFPADATAAQSKVRLCGLVNDLLKLAKTNTQAAAIVTKFNLSQLKFAK